MPILLAGCGKKDEPATGANAGAPVPPMTGSSKAGSEQAGAGGGSSMPGGGPPK